MSRVSRLNPRPSQADVKDAAGRRLDALRVADTDQAHAVATRHDSNGTRLTKLGVVLSKGPLTAFDGDMVESLCVGRDPISGRLAGTYTGYGTSGAIQRAKIGLAYSDDGVTWQKYPTQIFEGSGVTGSVDENGTTGSVWYYENGTYYLFYIGLTTTGYEGGEKTICLATSTSLTGPWTRRGAMVSKAGAGWRANAVWHVSVVKRAGIYYMFFNATASDSKEKIGYATATSLLGPWTVDDVNSPLLVQGTNAREWDNGLNGDPHVRRIGDMWVMDYYSTSIGGSSWAGDGLAFTTDALFPLGWQKYNGNPVLVPSATYDAKYAHKPINYVERGKVYHYYTAVSATDARSVALAVSADPVAQSVPVTDSFDRANSSTVGVADSGQTWTQSGTTGWAILSNALRWTGTADGGNAVINSGLADNFEIEFRLTALQGNFPIGVIIRYTDASNYSKVYRNATGWSFQQVTAGVGGTNWFFADATALVAGDRITVRVRGAAYTIYVNGVRRANWVIQGNIAATTVQGVQGNANLNATVEDYLVRAI